MEVIGVGLPRTGTLSQKAALEMLGLGPCYHMVNLLGDLSQVPQWRRALDGGTPWEGIFAGFQATVDWPGAYFYPELIEAYPDAKVVLSIRDPESWERSMRSTIWGVLYDDIPIRHLSAARACIDSPWAAYIALMQEMWRRSSLIIGQNGDRPGALAAGFERYQEQVVQAVPSERLLVWSVSEGWDPLCKFLGVDVPDAPFPHLNDSREFGERVMDGAMVAIEQWRKQNVQGERV
jgi:hypothetical protein